MLHVLLLSVVLSDITLEKEYQSIKVEIEAQNKTNLIEKRGEGRQEIHVHVYPTFVPQA